MTCFERCITPYEPGIEPSEINKYVVSGQVTDQNEIQTVSVSMASPVSDPQYIPVPGCTVLIRDGQGNEFPMNEYDNGSYRGLIKSSNVIPGASFKVEILTTDGTKIESDYDTLHECPQVDSVYYLRKDIDTEKSEGIQFFLNLDGGSTNSRYFRWELTETWEYHVPYPREWYYDGTIHHISPPDYSRTVCWSTVPVRNIYTLTTSGFKENKYELLPLNFIDNQTSRLLYGYSLLVNQFSMSDAAYSYWDQLRANSGSQGGLYEKQPFTTEGNLRNLTDPNKKVLGYFGAYSVRSKRIFVRNVENLQMNYSHPCKPAGLRKGLLEFTPADYPAFLLGDKNGFSLVYLSTECVDCLSLGGINIKPDFWPW